MRLARRLVLLTAVTALLSGPVAARAATGPAASAAADQGWVRCANLAPGAPEDVYLYPFGDPDHPIVLTHEGYGYGSVSDYMPVVPASTRWRCARPAPRPPPPSSR